MPDPQLDRFWGVPTQALVSHLGTTQEGLTQSEAQRRLSQVGPNTLTRHNGPSVWGLLLSQFQSPLVLILVGACVMSLVASEWVDAAVVLAIVLISTLMGFAQETMAHTAMEKLRSHLKLTVTVLRDGQARTLSLSEVVPGDVVTLCAGSLVPADGVLLQSNDCFVNQSMLTGESVP
ncbi:MAG: magnesium-translocating P-type ATPase, partial [Burkholderiaceae bacterium]|nr:magnesium-translocating P-type ATPase [Burkholderiaceae bacterium]